MKEITNNFINEVENEYIGNDIYTIGRHALAKNKISSIVQLNEQKEFTKQRFSIDLKTLPATNQKASGRCWIFAGCNVLRERKKLQKNMI